MSEEVRLPSDGTRPCVRCGRLFLSHVPTAKFCTMVCRRKASQVRQSGTKHGGPSKVDISPPTQES
jgi:hypothetical protein